MTEVERALRSLAPEIAFPPTPDLIAGVSLERPASRRPARRRMLVVALAALALALAAGLALSPGARSAFRELFGIGSVSIVRLDEAPAAETARLVPFGRPVTFAQASRAVPFRIRVPDRSVARPPTRVYLVRAGGGIVSLAWCCERRVVLTEVRTADPGLIEKTVGPSTLVEEVSVGGSGGLWVEGADHVVRVVQPEASWLELPVRVKGGVLIWTSGDVTLRLEGDLSKEEALTIAEGIR
jgi:hypothetical protein